MDHRFNTLDTSLSNTVRKRIILFTTACVAVISTMFTVTSVAAPADESTTTTSVETSIETTTTEVSTTTTQQPTTTTQIVYTPEQIKYFDMVHVNRQVYSWGVAEPAMATFRTVAAYRGWSSQQIQSWETAVYDIMKGESGFCPNMLGGARLASTQGCIIARQGRRSDAGFGQLISIHYRHTTPGTGWLCKQEGLCSKWQIIATPWNSMTALLALIERSGTRGWCYNASARRHHRVTCNNPGLDV